jgi:hypothetical protein
MKTNHPAHGPVSLDRLHQIREILSKATAQSDGGNLGYAMADAVKVIDGAIAAFCAEAVLYAAEETLAYAKMGELHLKCLSQPMGDAVIPLYTALPAPVSVPDAISTRQAIAKMESHEPCDSINVAYKFGWNACRAAILQTGNYPATPDGLPAAAPTGIPMISDGWIPVSERMPEGSEEVLCTKEFDGPGDWRKKVGYWLAGKWVVYGASWTPTHWMPLPAAPQQECKHEFVYGWHSYGSKSGYQCRFCGKFQEVK